MLIPEKMPAIFSFSVGEFGNITICFIPAGIYTIVFYMHLPARLFYFLELNGTVFTPVACYIM